MKLKLLKSGMRMCARTAGSVLVMLALLLGSFVPAFAGTTGTISGTVTDGVTHAGVPGVKVELVSPTGKFSATTDKKGFFSVTGVSPDTYYVTFSAAGYEVTRAEGINVAPDQVVTLSPALSKQLQTIGRTSARSAASAYQPGQTQDTTTLTQAQIQTINGRDFNTNEGNLITSLPGGSLDANGYPVLRGGRENEEGLSFEGISIVDPYTTQFTNSLSVNGIGSFQLTPGAGNASVGNAGTGTINYTAKRGTYPAFGSLEVEAQTPVYDHQLASEYGFATPDGRFSNYTSFIGQRVGGQYGPKGLPAVVNGDYNGCCSQFAENNFINNMILKLGKDRSTELQFLYQNQIDQFVYDYGGLNGKQGSYSDPLFTQVGFNYGSALTFVGANLSTVQKLAPILPLDGYNSSGPLPQTAQYQPNELFKLQLSRSFNSSTFAKLAYYRVNSVVPFDLPDPNVIGADFFQGGARTGFTLDATKQLGDKNLLQAGSRFEYEHPVDYFASPDRAFRAVGGGSVFGQAIPGFAFLDFVSPTDPSCAGITGQLGLKAGGYATGGACGYLAAKGYTGGLPIYQRYAQYDRSTLAYYVTDQYSPSSKLKIEAGLRVDSSVTHLPNQYGAYGDFTPVSLNSNATRPSTLEPRISANYQFSNRDSLRASFARSEQNAPLAVVSTTVDARNFAAFANIPSYDVLTGKPATFCGSTKKATCTSYADQLFSLYQYYLNGPALTPVKPETFSSYEFTYAHAFNHNIAAKVTPFYTRGYDIVDRTNTVIGTNPNTKALILSPPVAGNAGVERTTGVEFQLTKEALYGLSGSLSATYINKFSNVPPLAPSEDFFPTIPAASLLLGNTYRVGFLSPFQATLAAQYRTHSGWRINPQITYNKGYPLNPGDTTAVFINGQPYNVTNTDVTGPTAGVNFGQYVDPANPGSKFNPNIAARLGTPSSNTAGGILSNARLNTNLTIEYSPPTTRSTFGVQIFNLFDQIYGRPSLNPAVQPISTGVLGPQTGQLPNYEYSYYATNAVPYLSPTLASQHGTSPYVLYQNQTPTTVLFYYKLKL